MPHEITASKTGVMVKHPEKDLYWGVADDDRRATSYGWVAIEHARMGDPKHVSKPADLGCGYEEGILVTVTITTTYTVIENVPQLSPEETLKLRAFFLDVLVAKIKLHSRLWPAGFSRDNISGVARVIFTYKVENAALRGEIEDSLLQKGFSWVNLHYLDRWAGEAIAAYHEHRTNPVLLEVVRGDPYRRIKWTDHTRPPHSRN